MTVGAGERACGRVRRTPPTDGRAELFSTDDRHVFRACLGTQKKAAARNSVVVYPPCRLAAANSPQPASDRLPACPPTISSNSEDAAAGATCAGVDNSVMHAEMLRSKYFSLCVSVQRARSVSLHACRLPHIGYCVRRLFPWALKKRKKVKDARKGIHRKGVGRHRRAPVPCSSAGRRKPCAPPEHIQTHKTCNRSSWSEVPRVWANLVELCVRFHRGSSAVLACLTT